ncbi:MAG: isoprenylcysteine carboxylmethyltransferase family protein [Candidatus Krumholzibacteriota bacterium]|nr:isoprenylcysteine carboxylmethyltransferase family protein [Candidatus Krumholzibacteriota bacterium]
MPTVTRQALKTEPISRPLGFIGRAMVVVESVLFPLIFLFFAAGVVSYCFHTLDEPVLGAETPVGVMAALLDMFRHPGQLPDGTTNAEIYMALGTMVVRPLLTLFFVLMCAAFIALRSGLRYAPTTFREVLVPVVATFLMVLLPLSTKMGWLGRAIPYPQDWTFAVMATGTVLGIAGGGFTVYALLYLRRNFSIFVEVREIVIRGPYRYIRHPMYLGEIVMAAGVVLVTLSPFSIALLVGFMLLQHLRARMEQDRLSMASPEYAEHTRRSGMFFPKIGNLPGES